MTQEETERLHRLERRSVSRSSHWLLGALSLVMAAIGLYGIHAADVKLRVHWLEATDRAVARALLEAAEDRSQSLGLTYFGFFGMAASYAIWAFNKQLRFLTGLLSRERSIK